MSATNFKSYNWQEYWHYCEIISEEILSANQTFQQVIAITRGGFYLGDYLSRRLQIPLAVMAVKSYSDDTNQQQDIKVGALSFVEKPQGNVLLVDDLVDTGITLQVIRDQLIKYYGVRVTTAVLWYKDKSIFTPDYFSAITSADDWIIQPFENNL